MSNAESISSQALYDAVIAARQLTQLWPLTQARELDNDAKYAENLEVRMMRVIAQLLIHDRDVTMPDAEFVYEGADEIPGRPQAVVDALLLAADAYDAMEAYEDSVVADLSIQETDFTNISYLSECVITDQDTHFLQQLAQTFEIEEPWESLDATAIACKIADQTSTIATAQLEGIAAGWSAERPKENEETQSADCSSLSALALRVTLVVIALQNLVCQLSEQSGCELSLPIILHANMMCERLGLPRVMLSDQQWQEFVACAYEDASGIKLLNFTLPLMLKEWSRHYEDVLWDPEEAKKKAKEEDERKSREALAAKFAHVKGNTSATQALD